MPQDLERQRKRLRFRCWHRGTRELDLLLGTFADHHLGDLDAEQLLRMEDLLELPEPALFAWITNQADPPAELDHDVMAMLRAFRYPSPAAPKE